MKRFIPLLFLITLLFASHAAETDSISLIIEKHIDETDPPLPELSVLIDEPLSNVSICKGPGNSFYLTGTSGNSNGVNEGIKVWTSKDLKNWYPLTIKGYVWTFENDGKNWQKEIISANGIKKRAIINPGIYFIKNNFWITYTLTNTNYSGILKSISGNASG
ncbi:MAG: hypothetical protein JW798_09465, partial [Prolixibacteraceae bacterium]|nr:hypothetical protein [Prolixibacteraceae bacterium]